MTASSQIPERLKQFELFREMPLDLLEDLASRMICHHVQQSETLVHSLDESSEVYYVLSGRLRATLCSTRGRQTIFRDFGPGELVGEFAAIDGQMRSATISVLAPGIVARQSAAEFHDMLEKHHVIAKALMRHLTKKIRALVRRVYELSSHSVRERLYAELLRLADKRNGANELTILDPPTHEEIANMIGTHREAITRELGQLTRDGVISKSGKTVTISNPNYLIENLETIPS